jgi:hypothetical protein
VARHLELRSFGCDLHGLLSVILLLSQMSLSSLRRYLTTYETLLVYLQKTNLPCQHVMEASTYITVHYRNGIHVSSRCMDSVQPRTPSV